MDKVKSFVSNYWWVALPLAAFGGYIVWKMYIQPRVMPAPAA